LHALPQGLKVFSSTSKEEKNPCLLCHVLAAQTPGITLLTTYPELLIRHGEFPFSQTNFWYLKRYWKFAIGEMQRK